MIETKIKQINKMAAIHNKFEIDDSINGGIESKEIDGVRQYETDIVYSSNLIDVKVRSLFCDVVLNVNLYLT